jgi:hypothetical protein
MAAAVRPDHKTLLMLITSSAIAAFILNLVLRGLS